MTKVEEARKKLEKLSSLEQLIDRASSTDERLSLIAAILTEGVRLILPAPIVSDPPYNVRKYLLDTARTKDDPLEVALAGDILTFYSDGSLSGVEFALDSPVNDWIPISEFGNPYRYPAKFNIFYLTWTAQSGKYLRIHVGREAGAEASLQILTQAELRKVSTATPTAVTVGNTTTSVLSANSFRVFATFINDSTEVIYLALGSTAVMNEGIRLNASGGAYLIDATNLYTGAVSAICSSGSKVLTVTEG